LAEINDHPSVKKHPEILLVMELLGNIKALRSGAVDRSKVLDRFELARAKACLQNRKSVEFFE
jgi:hypothetical protein